MQSGRLPLLVAVTLLLGGSGAAQAPQTPPSVTFQVEVNYVDVDAIVTDENGNFVTGLTREDFEVFEDGKPQKVEMFSYVELPVEPPDRFAALGRPVSTDARSNARPFDGRIYVLVLDDLDISPLRTSLVKTIGARVRRAAPRRERSGGGGLHERPHRSDAGLHKRSALLLAAIESSSAAVCSRPQSKRSSAITSRKLTAVTRRRDNDCRRSRRRHQGRGRSRRHPRSANASSARHGVLDTLRNLGEFLAGVRGRRKAVLLFSEGLEMPMSEIYGIHVATDVVGAIKDAITAAAQSNVNFFALDPRGLIGMTSEFIEIAGLGRPRGGARGIRLAERATGASARIRSCRRTACARSPKKPADSPPSTQNTLGSAFERIVDANSRYYVLGYYPPTHGARWPIPPHRGSHEAAGAARVRAPRLCLPARPHACRAKARRGITEGARGQARRRQQHVARAARRAQCPAAAERTDLHDAGGAVQTDAERGIGRAGHRVRRRTASLYVARQRRSGDKHDRAVVFRDQPGRQSAAVDANTIQPDAASRVVRAGQGGRPACQPEIDPGARPISDSGRRPGNGRQPRRHRVLRPAGPRLPEGAVDAERRADYGGVGTVGHDRHARSGGPKGAARARDQPPNVRPQRHGDSFCRDLRQ